MPNVVALLTFGLLILIALWIFARRATAPKPSPAPPIAALPPRFVVFDLETTGLDPNRHEIIEIGAIKVERDSNLQTTFQTLVTPARRIPKKITALTGISQRMVQHDGKSLADALRAFATFIEDVPLVAFNAEFDMAFLRKSAKQHNLVVRNPSTCALQAARLAWPGRSSYRLKDLARDWNLSDEGTHRALGDCRRTLIIYTAAVSPSPSPSTRPLP